MCTLCEEELCVFAHLATLHESSRLPQGYTEEEMADYRSSFDAYQQWMELPSSLQESEFRKCACSFLRTLRRNCEEARDLHRPHYLRAISVADNLYLLTRAYLSDRHNDSSVRVATRAFSRLLDHNRDLINADLCAEYPHLSKILFHADPDAVMNNDAHQADAVREATHLYSWLNNDWLERLKTEYGGWQNPNPRERERSEMAAAIPFLWIGLKVLSQAKEIELLKKVCETNLLDLHIKRLMALTRAATMVIFRNTEREAFQAWVQTCPSRTQLYSALTFDTKMDRDVLAGENLYDRGSESPATYFGRPIAVL